MTNSVKLIVKAPNQTLTDQTYDVCLDWTVHQLKSYLSNEYPNKPNVCEQRLIYSGHLLKDDQILNSVFQSVAGDSITVHLVCTQKAFQSNTVPQAAATSNAGPHTDSQNNVNPVNNAFVDTPTPNLMNLAMTPDQMMQQMQLMQHMYMQFMTAQYVGNVQAIPDFTPLQAGVVAQPQVPVANPVVPDQAQVEPRAEQPVRLNAGAAGGAADDDEEVNRDWLDWVYWASRAIVLFSIVYFYSSFSRFLVVIGLTAIMYLYQVGLLFPRDRRDRANANNNRNNQAQNPENVVQRNERLEGDSDNHPHDALPTETERFSGLRLFWVIVTSLFTSLIPEQIPQNI